MTSDKNNSSAAGDEHQRRTLLKAAESIQDPGIRRTIELFSRGQISTREAGMILDDSPNAMRAVMSFAETYDSMTAEQRDALVRQAQSEIEQVAAELDTVPKSEEPQRRVHPRDDDQQEDFDQIDWTSDGE